MKKKQQQGLSTTAFINAIQGNGNESSSVGTESNVEDDEWMDGRRLFCTTSSATTRGEDENNNVDGGCFESKCDESSHGLEITLNNKPQVDSNAEEGKTTLCYERLVEVLAVERRQLNAEIASLRLKANQLEAELQLAGVLNRDCYIATPSNKQQL